MNTIDVLEFTETAQGSNSPTSEIAASSSNSAHTTQPTLNEEVSQVMGQLGKFWGGFRKQSQTVFESARKDLGQVVVQAREELGKLTSADPNSSNVPATSQDAISSSSDLNQSAVTDEKPAAKDLNTAGPDEIDSKGPEVSEPATTSFSSFFSRLQSSLPPTLAPTATAISQTVQRGISTGASQVDLNQIRGTVISNIQRVQQGITISQAEKLAEEYLHKSEALLKDAGTFLKDAVKVVPPDEGEDFATNAIWDGTDVWMFPSPVGTAGWGAQKNDKGKAVAAPPRIIQSSNSNVRVTRRDALLKRLKYDAEMLKLDPSQDEIIQERYSKFVKDEWEGKGGLSGELWDAKVKSALAGDGRDATALGDTKAKLVPNVIDEETFWTRYFFRIDQIEQEEELRKAVLKGAIQKEEEFSWEDDDEDSAPKHSTATKASESTSTLIPGPIQTSKLSAPSGPSTTNTSPSEESFDVIGSETSTSEVGAKSERKPRVKKGESESEDSDWE